MVDSVGLLVAAGYMEITCIRVMGEVMAVHMEVLECMVVHMEVLECMLGQPIVTG